MRYTLGMCDEAFKKLRCAVDEKHREAHRKIDELEEYLSGSAGVTANVQPKKPRVSRVPQATTARGLVDEACAEWISVTRIARRLELSEPKVRGVLYDPHYKDRYSKRKLPGKKTQFKLMVDGAEDKVKRPA